MVGLGFDLDALGSDVAQIIQRGFRDPQFLVVELLILVVRPRDARVFGWTKLLVGAILRRLQALDSIHQRLGVPLDRLSRSDAKRAIDHLMAQRVDVLLPNRFWCRFSRWIDVDTLVLRASYVDRVTRQLSLVLP